MNAAVFVQSSGPGPCNVMASDRPQLIASAGYNMIPSGGSCLVQVDFIFQVSGPPTIGELEVFYTKDGNASAGIYAMDSEIQLAGSGMRPGMDFGGIQNIEIMFGRLYRGRLSAMANNNGIFWNFGGYSRLSLRAFDINSSPFRRPVEIPYFTQVPVAEDVETPEPSTFAMAVGTLVFLICGRKVAIRQQLG